ncbi:MAG: pyridoxine 5'-phosphate synthase [Flavobacteriaceae bacterium]
MTKLSVNINKVATIRNARGGNAPDLIQVATDLQSFGAEGITVHPRPDERHIRYADVRSLPACINTEFNVEGNPSHAFLELVMEVVPQQVTLVPDAPDAITSNAGWDTQKEQKYLRSIIEELQQKGIRTSIFVDPDPEMVSAALDTGTDRIELYTEAYAKGYSQNPEAAIAPYQAAAEKAQELSIGLNAGHDLSLENIAYFAQNIPGLLEVSIGHALICESLYLGFENVVPMYLNRLK